MKKKKNKRTNKKKITRKEAIKKVGIYTAYTALGTLTLLSSKAAQAGSETPASPW